MSTFPLICCIICGKVLSNSWRIIGFRDDKFDKIFGGRDKLNGLMEQFERDACLELFKEYNNMQHNLY